MSLPEQRVIPALRITQYERSKAFYLDQLGFELEWEHRFAPHLPVFMAVVCDRMRLYLSAHAGDCQVGGLVHFVVPEVETWHQDFLKRGVPVTVPPNNDLGFWQMTIADPDGNQLRFMEPGQNSLKI
ncbi:glyoxalase superfamily protein [Nodosilinea sp. PGN35]|uniref:glyoxalase superfamily protein n=1 Tax=Nodosilinea sp. PGN35 TaxID=3020489 RepID=UPI0023B20DAF|nr:glyoxalase superfamily protein [Nodosilinea sp. TSF1-S3]MDF0365236.1 glyoxalase superfamily protein [Nodosilinea sp. TSF1-S3]